MESFFVIILFLYVFDILFLFYYGIHCYVMVVLFLRNRASCYTDPERLSELVEKMGDWPQVTVQLPIFNEFYVLERLIQTTMQIDYPKDKFQVQVLDDSTDESARLAEMKVKEYQAKGFDIEYIHRDNRKGHKAGALKAGQERASGEFIAIFDADFLPPKDFLRKTIPYFYESDKVGMVQTRWGHINADYSLLTKAQSIGIDGHFIIEQVARAGSKLWLNFNGTAGIWKKSCIYDSGNWQEDTLTEDFDLSYRAELKGWKFRYITDVISPAELPATVPAYKSQQFRWCKGSIQCAVKLIPRILKSKESWAIKAEALTHLTNYSVHPLMILNILATLPLLLYDEIYNSVSMPVLYTSALILMVGTFGPMVMYSVSQKALYPNWKQRMKWLPLLIVIGTGIAVSNTKAWIEALIGKKSGFIRTPKLRLESSKDKLLERNKYQNVQIDKVSILEFFMGVYILITIYAAFLTDKLFVIPFLSLYAAGFFYISLSTLFDKLKTILTERSALSRVS